MSAIVQTTTIRGQQYRLAFKQGVKNPNRYTVFIRDEEGNKKKVYIRPVRKAEAEEHKADYVAVICDQNGEPLQKWFAKAPEAAFKRAIKDLC
jgi:histidyl-tRNA synthetase